MGTNSYEGRDSFTRTRTHISKVFTQYDKDQSGYLDPVEFDEVFPQKEPYISAKKALHLIYRNIGLFVCVCVCVCDLDPGEFDAVLSQGRSFLSGNTSSVNPKSTLNQSSKPCTVLQYPSTTGRKHKA